MQRLKYAAGSEAQQAAGQAGDSSERNKLERQRHKHERLARVMIAVKAGIQHLSERLEDPARRFLLSAVMKERFSVHVVLTECAVQSFDSMFFFTIHSMMVFCSRC